MHPSPVFSVMALLFCSVSCLSAQVALPPDSTQLVLTKKVDAVYPPIAKAAHVTGTVTIAVTLEKDGHVSSTKVLSGSPMLAGAALNAVKQWIYNPIIADGKPTAASTTVSVTFTLPGPHNPDDEQIAREFFPLQDTCLKAFSSKADPSVTAQACGEAAKKASTFSEEERFIERRGAYTYASTAYLLNQQTEKALIYAHKAVAVVAQGHDDGSGSSAAYSVQAQAEAANGDLTEAADDLTQAENFERQAIQQLADSPELVKHQYIPALRGLLNFHAQVLQALGHADEAEAKTAEAAKL